MLFGGFSFSEVALSDIRLQIRALWREINPTSSQTWVDRSTKII
tara:strand:+ start:1641 stop:1772 length:132 start_codon:yes stop_codon:yes gene_type:complete